MRLNKEAYINNIEQGKKMENKEMRIESIRSRARLRKQFLDEEESLELTIERTKKYVESFFTISTDKTVSHVRLTYDEFLKGNEIDEEFKYYCGREIDYSLAKKYFCELWNKLPEDAIRTAMQEYYKKILKTPLQERLLESQYICGHYYELGGLTKSTATVTTLAKESILLWKAGEGEWNIDDALACLLFSAKHGCPEACYLLATTEIDREYPRYNEHGEKIFEEKENRNYLCKDETEREKYLWQAYQSNYMPAVKRIQFREKCSKYDEKNYGKEFKENEVYEAEIIKERIEKEISKLDEEIKENFEPAKSGNVSAQLKIGKNLLKKVELQSDLSDEYDWESVKEGWCWIEKAAEYSDEAKLILAKEGRINIAESWDFLKELSDRNINDQSALMEAAKLSLAIGKNEETENYLRRLTESGNQEAEFKLAQFLMIYKENDESAKIEALKLFILSAEKLNRGALMAALMFLRGVGAAADINKAKEYFELATRKNTTDSCYDEFVDLYEDVKCIGNRYCDENKAISNKEIDEEIDTQLAQMGSTRFCAEFALLVGWGKVDISKQIIELMLRWLEDVEYTGLHTDLCMNFKDMELLKQNNKELKDEFDKYFEKNFEKEQNLSFTDFISLEFDFWDDIYKVVHLESMIKQLYALAYLPNWGLSNTKKSLDSFYEINTSTDVNINSSLNKYSIIENYILGRVAMTKRMSKRHLEFAETYLKQADKLIKEVEPHIPNVVAYERERNFFNWLKECNAKAILKTKNFILEEKNTELEFARQALEERNIELDKTNLELSQAKSELEDMMAMFAHKFRGPVASIIANADSHHQNREVLFKDIGRTMDGLLDVFSYVSSHSENLIPRLRDDIRGEHGLIHVFNKALWLSIIQLLTKRNVDRMNMYYFNYARTNDRISKEIEYRAWRKEKPLRDIREAIRSTWEIDIGAYGDFTDIDRLVEWCSTKISPIKFKGIKESTISFSDSGVKESLLLVIFTEMFVNAIKHYELNSQDSITVEWLEGKEEMKLILTNPTSVDARVRGEGSGRGLKFLSLIAKNVKGYFTPPENADMVSATFSFPSELFNTGE